MCKSREKLQLLFLFLVLFPLTAQTSSLTSDGYLRDWQNEDGHVAYSVSDGNVTSVMTADDERLVLRKYDEKHRLTSEVIWGSGYETITSETVWTYPEQGVYPETMEKKLPEQNQRVKVLYTADGLETERTTWNTEAEQEDILLEKTAWQYDDQKRVISKSREYYEEAGESGEETVRTEKTEYEYTEKADEPDSAYYENGILVERIVQISDGSHIESLFFDDMEIKTLWVDGVRTEEIYYLDGKEVKRKTL